MKVGFIGLGIMGRPLAGHLLKGGYPLNLFDLGKLPEELIDGGAVGCASGRDVAERSDIMITMVPDTPHVEAALFGSNGVAERSEAGQDRGGHELDCPMATKDFAKRINEKGCDYLDAPVSGGEVGARTPRSTIMVGGPERAFDKVEPLLELMGKNMTLVGDNGDGRPPRSPTRSSSRSTSRPWARRCCSPPRPAPIRRRCGRP